MDIHESGVVSGIGISPAARHVCCATLVYSHSATAKNIANGYVVHVTYAGDKSVVTQTSNYTKNGGYFCCMVPDLRQNLAVMSELLVMAYSKKKRCNS